MVTTGFQRIERALDRITFLQESQDTLTGITLRFDLDREYSGEEIGHFRAFCYLHLKEPKLKIFGILFGTSDKSQRTNPEYQTNPDPPGIKHGIGGGQWEEYFDPETPEEQQAAGQEPTRYRLVGSLASVGIDPVRAIYITYSHDSSYLRFEPRINFRDIDEATFIPMLNKSLAEKVKAVSVIANGYLLQRTTKLHFQIDPQPFDPEVPLTFDQTELLDPWVRIRPERSSAFSLSFSDETPKRLFESRQIVEEL